MCTVAGKNDGESVSELEHGLIDLIYYETQNMSWAQYEQSLRILRDNIKMLTIHAIALPSQKVQRKILVHEKYLKNE